MPTLQLEKVLFHEVCLDSDSKDEAREVTAEDDDICFGCGGLLSKEPESSD